MFDNLGRNIALFCLLTVTAIQYLLEELDELRSSLSGFTCLLDIRSSGIITCT